MIHLSYIYMVGNRVQWRASPYKKIIIKLMIGIHHKLSVTHVVGLATIRMVVLFKVLDKIQTTAGLAMGATGRP